LMVASLRLLAIVTALVLRWPEARALESVSADPLAVGAATAIGVGLVLLLGRAWHDPGAPWPRVLELRAVRWSVIGLAIISGLALQIPLTELQNAAEILFPISPEQKEALYRLVAPGDRQQALGTFLTLAVVVPVCEELLFRGLILPGLRRRYGPAAALLLSSALFGLSHMRLPAAIAPSFAAGLVLGAIALRTRSTGPAIVLHAAINAAPMLLSAPFLDAPGFNAAQEDVSHVPLWLLLPACAMAAAGLGVLLASGGRGDASEGH